MELAGLDEGDHKPTILVPGRPAMVEEIPPRTTGAMLKRLNANGWKGKVGYSKYEIAPKTYGPKAKKAGEEYGGAIVDNIWVDAINIERKERFTANWHDGSFVSALWRGRLVNHTTLNKLITGELTEVPTKDYVHRTAREREYEA